MNNGQAVDKALVLDRYAARRQEPLLGLIDRMSQSGNMFEGVNRTLWLMSGLYEQAARTVSVMWRHSDDTQPTVLKFERKPRKMARAPRARSQQRCAPARPKAEFHRLGRQQGPAVGGKHHAGR